MKKKKRIKPGLRAREQSLSRHIHELNKNKFKPKFPSSLVP